METRSLWKSLPIEMQLYVLSLLSPLQHAKKASVSKQFRHTLTQRNIQSLFWSTAKHYLKRLPKPWQNRVINDAYPIELAIKISACSKLSMQVAKKKLITLASFKMIAADKQRYIFNSTLAFSLLRKGLLSPEEIHALTSIQHLQILCTHAGAQALNARPSLAKHAASLTTHELQKHITTATAHRYVSI